MSHKRREFLKNSSLITSAFLFSNKLKSIAGVSKNNSFLRESLNSIALFHSNDLHGRVSDFSFGKKSGLGGIQNVKNLLKEQGNSDILLDAGDFLNDNSSLKNDTQFIELMNAAGYNAVTIGNRDLAKGQDYLASLTYNMKFKLVNCNYEFSNKVLKNKVLPYHIIKYGQYKIGVTGVGHDLSHLDKNITYYHPYKKANEVAAHLKNKMHCDLVICLSHLGFEQQGNTPDNKKFAQASENIDLIISGHTEKIMNTQIVEKNLQKQQVIVSHAGLEGLMIGKLKFTFNDNREQHLFNSKNYIPGFPTDQSIYEQYQKLIA